MKNAMVEKALQEKYYSQKARDAMPDSDFAGRTSHFLFVRSKTCIMPRISSGMPPILLRSKPPLSA